MAITLSNVNIGTGPGIGDGDPLRTAFTKINNNFAVVQANINANAATPSVNSLNNNGWQVYLDSTGNTSIPKNLTTSGVLIAQGNIIVTGNLITNGGRIENGYQYYSPSGNLSFTANTNVSRVILDPSSAISLYANVTLPGGNIDAKVVSISSTANVQFLSVMPSVGCTLAPFGNIILSAGTKVEYFFHAVENKWYKVG